MADPAPIAVVRLAPGWWLDLGVATVQTTSSPGRAAKVPPPDHVLDSGAAPPAGVEIEALDGAFVIRVDGTAIGVGKPATLAGVDRLDLALVEEGAAIGNVPARFVLPSSAPGVGGPRGVPVRPGEVATFTGRGEDLYVYSVEAWPRGATDRWGWLRGRGS
ncbi:MAG: hypothetical protein GY898_20885 [Proteobacteria bacterium]|nr:hypothetical protein [Pseudomonadota bacterium]